MRPLLLFACLRGAVAEHSDRAPFCFPRLASAYDSVILRAVKRNRMILTVSVAPETYAAVEAARKPGESRSRCVERVLTCGFVWVDGYQPARKKGKGK